MVVQQYGRAGRRRLWMKLAKLIENRVPIVMALETLYTRRRAIRGDGDPQVIAYDHGSKE